MSKSKTDKKKPAIDEKRYWTRRRFREEVNPLKPYSESALRGAIKSGKLFETTIEGRNLIDMKDKNNLRFFQLKKGEVRADEFNELKEIEARKKQIELEKAIEDLEIKKQERLKKQGELVPVDLVGNLFGQYVKQILQEMNTASQRIASDTVIFSGGDKTKIPELKGKITKVLNNQISQARTNMRNRLQNIVDEYTSGKVVDEI